MDHTSWLFPIGFIVIVILGKKALDKLSVVDVPQDTEVPREAKVITRNKEEIHLEEIELAISS